MASSAGRRTRKGAIELHPPPPPLTDENAPNARQGGGEYDLPTDHQESPDRASDTIVLDYHNPTIQTPMPDSTPRNLQTWPLPHHASFDQAIPEDEADRLTE
jgi:hypothetical protein